MSQKKKKKREQNHLLKKKVTNPTNRQRILAKESEFWEGRHGGGPCSQQYGPTIAKNVGGKDHWGTPSRTDLGRPASGEYKFWSE